MKRMMLLILLVLFAALGCSRRTIVRKYYLIELPAVHDSTALKQRSTSNSACELLPVDISPAFAGERIPARLSSHELTYYNLHFWAIKPSEAITKNMEAYLQNQRIFSAVATRFWKVVPEYQIRSRIYQLETVQSGSSLSAHLNIEFVLRDNRTEQIVLMHTADRSLPLRRKNMNHFAAAISKLLDAELGQFAKKIETHLQETSSPTAGQD